MNHRYVPASAFIDVPRLGDEPRHTVPLNLAEADLDACELRGRMLADVKFARGQVNHYIWVDGSGHVRSPTSDRA